MPTINYCGRIICLLVAGAKDSGLELVFVCVVSELGYQLSWFLQITTKWVYGCTWEVEDGTPKPHQR